MTLPSLVSPDGVERGVPLPWNDVDEEDVVAKPFVTVTLLSARSEHGVDLVATVQWAAQSAVVRLSTGVLWGVL